MKKQASILMIDDMILAQKFQKDIPSIFLNELKIFLNVRKFYYVIRYKIQMIDSAKLSSLKHRYLLVNQIKATKKTYAFF